MTNERISSVYIKHNNVESGRVGSIPYIFQLREHIVNISTSLKLRLLKYMVQLSTTMEQTHETQLAQLYDVLGFRQVIACYDVLSTLH